MSYAGTPRIVQRLPVPPSARVTNAAPTTLLARAGFTPREPATVYGVLPVEMVEGFEPERAYDVKPIEGLGRAPNRGLGQSDEQVLAARDQLLQMINAAIKALGPYLGSRAGQAVQHDLNTAQGWFQQGIEKFYGGDNTGAQNAFVHGLTIMQRVMHGIRALTPQDKMQAAAQARTQAGASFPGQVSQTIESVKSAINEPIATAIESVSPAAAEAVRSAGWLLPAGAGLALFMLLRR